MIVEERGILVWTRVRLPPGPLFVLGRDPTKLGGVLTTYVEYVRSCLVYRKNSGAVYE